MTELLEQDGVMHLWGQITGSWMNGHQRYDGKFMITWMLSI